MSRRRAPAPIAVRYRASERAVDPAALDAAVRELARALVRRILAQKGAQSREESSGAPVGHAPRSTRSMS